MRTAPTRAERQAGTRRQLVAAADRLFTGNGFHATSLDAIANEAGVTKGAVYSNFDGKEDLFFAVYEERVRVATAEAEALLAAAGSFGEAIEGMVAAAADRRGGAEADGWLAVFFEFWAHVLRHREHLGRFAELHARFVVPGADALAEHAEREGIELPEEPRRLVTAWLAMQLGLSLEQLTQPELIDKELRTRLERRHWEGLRG